MLVLTEDAVLGCLHGGVVAMRATQHFVTVHGRRVLVDGDPEQRPIGACPNVGPAIKPCTSTLAVQQGYSDLVRIDGRRACLDTVEGLTDGTPPGTVRYRVRHPGQELIAEVA